MKKTFSSKYSFLRTTFLLLMISHFTADAQNLVTNGDFSNNGNNWAFFAPAIATEAYNFEPSYGGPDATNKVAEIDNECNLRQTGIAVVPGNTYWFSFRRSRRTGNGAAPNPTTIKVKVYDGSTTYIDQTLSSVNTTWNWQCETYQFTASGNSISIDFQSVAATTLGTMVDDITITPVIQPIMLTGYTCQGGSITLKAPSYPNDPNAVYSNYSWTGVNGFTATGSEIVFNNAQPSLNGSYTCTMTLNNCLTVTGTYNLTVVPSVFPSSQDICLGETYNFYGRLLYATGDYDTLITSNDNSCDSFVVLHLHVHPKPDVNTRPYGNIDICLGDTSTLSVRTSAAGTTYQWFDQNTTISGETGPAYKASASGGYRVIAVTDKGCRDSSDIIGLEVHTPPQASISIQEATNPCISDTISFFADPGAFAYAWMPQSIFRNTGGAEGNSALGILRNTSTKVFLTVYDATGCYTSDSLTVSAHTCCRLFIPNAFSPNGDGLNDFFMPRLKEGQIMISLSVFDRWGKVIYSDKTNGKKGWNGYYTDGSAAAAGVYMYQLEYTCGDHKIEQEKGDFTLIL